MPRKVLGNIRGQTPAYMERDENLSLLQLGFRKGNSTLDAFGDLTTVHKEAISYRDKLNVTLLGIVTCRGGITIMFPILYLFERT